MAKKIKNKIPQKKVVMDKDLKRFENITSSKNKVDAENISTEITVLPESIFDRDEFLFLFEDEKAKLAEEKIEIAKEKIALSALKAEAKTGFENIQQQICIEAENELKQRDAKKSEEFDAYKKQLFDKEAALSQREKVIFSQTLAINTKQESANAGFVQEQLNVIEQYRSDIKAEKETLYHLKKQQAEEISEHAKSLTNMQFEDEQRRNNELKQRQDALNNQERKLSQSEINIETQKISLEKMEASLNARISGQSQWESETQKQLQKQLDHELRALEDQVSFEQEHLKKEQNKNTQLQVELREFADLQRTFDNADPKDINEEFRRLKKENRELKSKNYLNDEDLGEKCEILEEQLADKSDELRDCRRDLEEAQGELHKRNMSVMEKQHLVQEKRILEQHKRTLDAAVEQLRTQVDDLIERQQGSETFPALSSLDKKHRHAASNIQPVPELKAFANQLRFGMARIYPDAPLYYREEDVRFFLAGIAMSQLHILQGMSGTGKTSLAKAFTKVVGGYCTDIAVQSGWRDKDDLLGHYNAFEKRFYEKETLQALYRAQLPEYKDRINIILLDEMNLSRPEQYFAEFLSAIEMRPEDRKIVLIESEQIHAPTLLKEGRILKIPDNVWFIGTANHDETTNEFADKTYDRAHVMELMRNEGTFNADAYEADITYSVESLERAFKKACNAEKTVVEKMLKILSESTLNTVLEESFSVSWGNRFARHALRFLPVVKHCGGTFEEALDHLLATKVFRHGKATGRYDVNLSELDKLQTALKETWKVLDFTREPITCLNAINKDRKRMERGV